MTRGDRLLLIAVLAAVGIANAAYLTWQWYNPGPSVCDINDVINCEKVRMSAWSSVAGIPMAVIGLGGFVILLGLAVLSLLGVDTLGPLSVERLLLGFAIAGAALGTVLTLVELFVIYAICLLCVLGFALDLAILGLVARGAMAQGDPVEGPSRSRHPGP